MFRNKFDIILNTEKSKFFIIIILMFRKPFFEKRAFTNRNQWILEIKILFYFVFLKKERKDNMIKKTENFVLTEKF